MNSSIWEPDRRFLRPVFGFGPPFDPPLHPPWLCGFHGATRTERLWGAGFFCKNSGRFGRIFVWWGASSLLFWTNFPCFKHIFFWGGGRLASFLVTLVSWLSWFWDTLYPIACFFDFVVKKIWLWLSTGWCLPIFYTIYQLIEQFRPLDPQTRGSIEKCHIIHIFIKTI